MAQLDLEPKPGDGDDQPPHEPGQSPRSQRRHRQKERQASGELNGRLLAIFERLADRFEGKGDLELADVIREDSRAMVGGLVSLTKRIPGAAAPILLVLGIVEPVLAFGRVFRLLASRWAYRRAEREGYAPEEPDADAPSTNVCSQGVEGCPVAEVELAQSHEVPHEHTADGILYL